MALYTPQQLGITASTTGGNFQEGAWYGGRQYWGGKLGEVNQIINPNQQGYMQPVSEEVRSQSAQKQGVSLSQFDSYLQSQSGVPANQLSSPANVPYVSGALDGYLSGLGSTVDQARKALEESLAKQKTENDAKLAELKTKETETMGQIDQLTTPFREDIETTQREELYVNKNFEENQKLVDELEGLLQEGNDYITQQKEITGLAAVRNPRIQKAIDDVTARVGVIEAVINARNGQISQAYTMIDRTVNAIAADRNDRISYYETVLELNNRDIISLDEDNKNIAQEQLNLLKNDLDRANATVDYVKELMINPQTAQLMGEAGVTLNDSVAQINAKLTQAQYVREVRDLNNDMAKSGYSVVFDPSSIPKNELITMTDTRGKTYYYKKSDTTGGSGSSIKGVTPTQERTYVSVALKTFDQIDRGFQTVDGKISERDEELSKGDKLISRQEFEFAYDQILNQVGNIDIAAEIINRAWEQGGYKRWKW